MTGDDQFLRRGLGPHGRERHIPVAFVVALRLFRLVAELDGDFLTGAAQPQIGIGLSRWRTMWLPSTLGSLTSARVLSANGRPRAIEQPMSREIANDLMMYLS